MPSRGLGRAAMLGGCALLAGLSGGLVSAALARVVMRLIAVLGSSHYGEVTHQGAVVGEITLAGTLTVVTAGVAPGLMAGMAYLGVHRLLPGWGVRRGLVLGGLFLVVGGPATLDPGNYEFFRYLSPLRAMLLFVPLFPICGVVVVVVAEWLSGEAGRVVRRPALRWAGRTLLGAVALAVLAADVHLLRSIRS